MRSIRLAASVASLAILAACASAPSKEAADPKSRIAADVAWLADDARMGRDPGTPGYDAAADYVENRMKSVGLKPAAIGWRQTARFAPRRESSMRRNSSWSLAALRLRCRLSMTTSLDGASTTRHFPWRAPLVYVGYGVVAPDGGVHMTGDLILLPRLLDGDWGTGVNSDFLIVPQGQRITLAYDERVIDCAGASSLQSQAGTQNP